MAIERMKAIWLFAPPDSARSLLDRLAALGVCHVAPAYEAEKGDGEEAGISQVFPEAGDLEKRVRTLTETLETLSPFHKTSREFLENFIPTALEVRRAEVDEALDTLEIERVHAEAKRMAHRHGTATAALHKAKEQLKAVSDLEGVTCTIPGRRDQCNTAAFLGVMSAAKFDELKSDERLPESCAVTAAARKKRMCIVQAASPADQRDILVMLLTEHDCSVIEPEEDTVSVVDYLAHRRTAVAEARAALKTATGEMKQIARSHHRPVEIALGYWEERLRIARTAGLLAQSKRVTMLKGYVRARELETFKERLAEDLPEVGLEVRDPAPGESTPVSLYNPKWMRPAEFAVSMFGMPNYRTFDPTPIIFFNFTIFFGICFGDAVYGLGLLALGIWLARKYRAYTSLRQLFTLLACAGVPTFAVGALTGSWAGGLFSASWLGSPNPLFGAGSVLIAFNNKLMVFELLDKLMLALVIALGIGILNQMIGMACLAISRYRKGDPSGAVLDTVFWFIALPGAVVLAATLFTEVPSTTKNVAFGALGIGGVGLVLTQGREQKNIFARLGLGIVSLYGVAGTYGFSSFLNDVLSYSRLLALGLATSVVGMAFNILGNMARCTGIGPLDVLFLAVILIVGHSANFFLGVLGSFVHSVRLVFVEFFGRFYQADAPTFAPIGTWAGRIRVTDARTIWSH